MTITYPPEMLPKADGPAEVLVQRDDGKFVTISICANCDHFMRLSPGHAGICRVQQRGGREWNDAMAVVNENSTCDDFKGPRHV